MFLCAVIIVLVLYSFISNWRNWINLRNKTTNIEITIHSYNNGLLLVHSYSLIYNLIYSVDVNWYDNLRSVKCLAQLAGMVVYCYENCC